MGYVYTGGVDDFGSLVFCAQERPEVLSQLLIMATKTAILHVVSVRPFHHFYQCSTWFVPAIYERGKQVTEMLSYSNITQPERELLSG